MTVIRGPAAPVDDITVEALRRFRALMDHSGDAVFIVDSTSGAVVDFNATACRRTGYGRHELLRLKVWDLEGSVPQPDAAWAETVRTLKGIGHMVRDGVLRCKDGTIIPTDVETTFVRQDDRDFVLAVSRDITVRRQPERTTPLAQVQEAQKLESIGRLAGGVAHEFNNLLTAIIGYAELLDRHLPADANGRGELSEILLAGRRAGALTRQLLSFTRTQLFDLRVLDLTSAVVAMFSMLQRLLGEHIELVHVAAPNLWPVRADEGQIDQLLLNLAVNARDAMPDGGILTIETCNAQLASGDAKRCNVAPGEYVMLAVTDTGTGMDARTQAHLFEPFFTTKGRGEGTGLGLSTVHDIVRQSDGGIDVDSAPGRGSRFRIYLPRVVEAANDSPTVSDADDRGARGATVLVAEDERAIRGVLRLMLEKLGYTVLMAPDGETALQMVRHHAGPIDLVLTDLVMPGMNGLQLSNYLRALRPSIRVLYATGYADPDVTKGISSEDAILRKPFTSQSLERALREALERAPASRD